MIDCLRDGMNPFHNKVRESTSRYFLFFLLPEADFLPCPFRE